MAEKCVLTAYYTDKYEGVAFSDQTTSEATSEEEKTELKEPYSNDSDCKNDEKDNKCCLTAESEMRGYFSDIHTKRNIEKTDAYCSTTFSINELDNYLVHKVAGYNEFSNSVCPIEESGFNTNAMDTNPTGQTSSKGFTFQNTSSDEKSFTVQISKHKNILQTITRDSSFMTPFPNQSLTCSTAQKIKETSKELTFIIDSLIPQPREENSPVEAMKSKLKVKKSSIYHSYRTCPVPINQKPTELEKEPIDIHQDETKVRGQNSNQRNIPCGKASKPVQLQRPKRHNPSLGLRTHFVLIVIILMMILGKTQGCKMKKNISTTKDTISMQVCYSNDNSECKGNERWDLAEPKGVKHLFLNMAVLEGEERYSLETPENCSRLSFTNVTEKDIYEVTYSFSKGPSDKIDIHLNQDPILGGKEQCILECLGKQHFLILKMLVKHGSPNVFFNLLFEEMVRNLTANTSKKDLLYESVIEHMLPFSFQNFSSSSLKVLFVNGNTQFCVLEKKLMVPHCKKGELEDSSEKLWGLFSLLALPTVAFMMLFILCIYKKELLCFKKMQSDREVEGGHDSVLLNGVNN